MDSQEQKVLGTVLYATTSLQDYVPSALFFTNNYVFSVRLAKLTAGQKASYGLAIAGWLAAGLNPVASGMGVSGLLGLNGWKKLKADVEGKPVVSLEEFAPSEELLKSAYTSVENDKVKEVVIKLTKGFGLDGVVISIYAGLIKTNHWYTMCKSVDEVTALISKTPLSSRMRVK